MTDGALLAAFILGVFGYKTIELMTLQQKVVQAFFRGNKHRDSIAVFQTVLGRLIAFLADEFYVITMIYCLTGVALLGTCLIIGQRLESTTYLEAKIVSLVTITASTFLAAVTLAVERFRTKIEVT